VTTETDLKIEAHELKKAALILRAINHKLRQQLLQFIHQRGTVTVTELYLKLHLEQSVASQHLAILRSAGYVLTKREGKCIYYSVNYKRLEQVQGDCRHLLIPKQ
jgi:DNA-binding transcriptional ArsR family regulator